MKKDLDRMRPETLQQTHYNKAMLCVGACEGHGPHLPFGTDTFIAEGIGRAVAEAFDDMLLLPSLGYGFSGGHMDFEYTLSLSQNTLIAVLSDIFASLYRRGMRRVVVINGHNGNTASIEVAARAFKVEHKDMVIVAMPAWWLALGALVPPGVMSGESGWHAGEAETAVALALFEEDVDMDKARPAPDGLRLNPLMDVKYSFDEISPSGAGGHPERASRAEGEQILAAVVSEAVDYIRYLDGIGWDYRPRPAEK